jgi:ADP-heptose:LPS heptosyltransferase
MQARDVCGHAEAVVGVDGGIIHLAATTDVPVIYAMTTTHPRHRMIARNGDPWHKIRYVTPRNLECAGCQSNWVLTYFDFTKCAYGDNQCTYMLHADDFIAGLKDLTGL